MYSREQVETKFADYAERIRRLRSLASESEYAGVRMALPRPELTALLRGVAVSVSSEGRDEEELYVSVREGSVALRPEVALSPALSSFFLRYGLEIQSWLARLGPSPGATESRAAMLLAFRTSVAILRMMGERERGEVLQGLDSSLGETYRLWLEQDLFTDDDWDVDLALVRRLGCFWPSWVRSASLGPPQSSEALAALLADMAGLALPTETILTLHGDSRLRVDAETGLNKYGCSPRPRPWAITFSSCTASSVSEQAFEETERLRQELLSDALSHGLADSCERQSERLRQAILQALGLSDVGTARLVFTSSGTDVEFYSAFMAALGSNTHVTNIVIGPNEVGSGTLQAASGKHFDDTTPFGDRVERGAPVEGFPVERISVETVEVRDAAGGPLPIDVIDGRVRELAYAALERGRGVLLHVLDCSKTALRGPSMATMLELLDAEPERVFVLVDTAQMRLANDALRFYLERGCMLLVTGSKFFTAPPFSGALVVPESVVRRLPEQSRLPKGLSGYCSQQDFSDGLKDVSARLPERPNVPALLRWQAALWEMSAFHAVPRERAFEIVRRFGEVVAHELEDNRALRLVSAPYWSRRGNRDPENWDELPTIFSFFVAHASGPKSGGMNQEDATRAYHLLNRSIGPLLGGRVSGAEWAMAERQCHIGQPVRIRYFDGEWSFALRVAAGARLVSGVQYDPLLGDSFEERLESELRDVVVVLRKLALITRHWDVLRGVDVGRPIAREVLACGGSA